MAFQVWDCLVFPPHHKNPPTPKTSATATPQTKSGETTVELQSDVAAPSDKCSEFSHATTLPASQESIVYAGPLLYDESTNPKEINWISEEIEAKIAPYKPDSILFSNNSVDQEAAETAF